jgi:hypothetical protein
MSRLRRSTIKVCDAAAWARLPSTGARPRPPRAVTAKLDTMKRRRSRSIVMVSSIRLWGNDIRRPLPGSARLIRGSKRSGGAKDTCEPARLRLIRPCLGAAAVSVRTEDRQAALSRNPDRRASSARSQAWPPPKPGASSSIRRYSNTPSHAPHHAPCMASRCGRGQKGVPARPLDHHDEQLPSYVRRHG